ncbi:MAG: helix-turn-helix transcriptional regulator [Clostridia bacterium]|nr:helix-turn-helix transcriptional regulator [Clostridia bacterium]
MPDYSYVLGDAIRSARSKLDLTQGEVADAIDVDVRTVLNIENYKGNPKMEVLFPLVRALKIDANEIFYPELEHKDPAISQLRLLIEDCSEDEAAAMIPIVQAILTAFRTKNTASMK